MESFMIGNVSIPNRLVLGPMAGVTDLPFRLLCREKGAGLLYTEMVSAKAITYHNRNTKQLLRTDTGEHPIAVQLFGSEPETIADAAEMIEDDTFDLFDLNMGCPVPKVVNNHEGSALMKDPVLAAEIVRTLCSRTRKPVTVKIRKGFTCDTVNAPEFAKVLEEAGASAIAVHGRTRSQYYAGSADWNIIREVKKAVSIPVIGNGDVTSPEKAKEMMDRTGCDAVMIARGARGNPWIFERTLLYLHTGIVPPPPSSEEIVQMILRHTQMLEEYKGEYTAVREMRKHIGWYTAGMRNSSMLRRTVNKIETMEELLRTVPEMLLAHH